MSFTDSFIKGDILKGRKDSKAIHPIIYLGEIDNNNFLLVQWLISQNDLSLMF